MAGKLVLITGSRGYPDRALVEREVGRVLEPDDVFVHGGCPNSPDVWGEAVAVRMNVRVLSCPAEWDVYGRAAGPKRNQQMVDLVRLYAEKCHAEVVALAFIGPGSRGAADCHRRMVKAGFAPVVWRS